MDTQDVKRLLHDAFADAEVEVIRDDHDDERSEGAHFGLVITSDEFEGESRVARHRSVYDALGDAMGNEIHAVEIRAQTYGEAE